MKKIDAHIHFFANHADSVNRLNELDIKLLNICVAHAPGEWSQDKEHYRSLVERYPDTFAWCTTFDPPDYRVSDEAYAERVIAELSADFASGAAACKIWKNVGMEFKKPTGEFLMVDDPIFRPIFEFFEKANRPVLMHIGEPLACWSPLDEKSPHYSYYKENPQWHMYGRKDFPSHGEIIAARDHVLELHPRVRFIGAHLGSLEYDVAEIAKRLDRYPNFVVDTSARMVDLMVQDNGKVAEFLTKYRDRVLYGSDFVDSRDQSALSPEDRQGAIAKLGNAYAREMDYLTSDRTIDYRGRSFTGLALSDEVTKKLLFDNAHRWYAI